MEQTAIFLAAGMSIWSVVCLLVGLTVGWRIKSGMSPMPRISLPNLTPGKADKSITEEERKPRPQEQV